MNKQYGALSALAMMIGLSTNRAPRRKQPLFTLPARPCPPLVDRRRAAANKRWRKNQERLITWTGLRS